MTPFLLHRGREPPMARLFRGSLDRAFERGAEIPEELSQALLEAPSELQRLSKVSEMNYRAVAEDGWELSGADPDLSVAEVEEGSF